MSLEIFRLLLHLDSSARPLGFPSTWYCTFQSQLPSFRYMCVAAQIGKLKSESGSLYIDDLMESLGAFKIRQIEFGDLTCLLESQRQACIACINSPGNLLSLHLETLCSTAFASGNESFPCCLVAKSCVTLCDTMDCSPSGFSVQGIFQARILAWVPIASQGIFPTQGSNLGLPHCRQMLYRLSHKGSLILKTVSIKRMRHMHILMISYMCVQ